MNTVNTIANLGTPIEVDVAAIEKELTSFWQSASTREGDSAVIRACSCNLVAVVQSRQEAESLPAVLAKVAEWHPNRSIVAYPEAEDDGLEHGDKPHMHAWIGAQCSIPFSGGPQICCEAITVAAQGKAILDLPNTLMALLVPDLPVFVYWRSLKTSDQELLGRVARFSDLLIVDSHQSKNDPQNRLRLLELLINPPAAITVRDLNWSRITAWRDLIAQFFDAASSRHYVREISEVEIVRDISSPGTIPTRTLLLTGWLVSRLGWKMASAVRSGDQWLSRWNSESGEVVVRFSGYLSPSDQVPGINSVTLRTRTGAAFSVVMEIVSSSLRATATTQGSPMTHSVPQESLDEASLLIRELSQTSEDAGFKAALAEALALEKSFLPPHSE